MNESAAASAPAATRASSADTHGVTQRIRWAAATTGTVSRTSRVGTMEGGGKARVKSGCSASQPAMTSDVAAARGKCKVSATKQSTMTVRTNVVSSRPPSAAVTPSAATRTTTNSTRRTAGGSRK